MSSENPHLSPQEGDASAGAEPALDREEMNTILSDLKGKISTAQR